MTAQTEKLFMNWILKKPNHFYNVKPNHFENEDISFVYKCVQDEYFNNENKVVLKPKEIINLVKIKDKSDKIPVDFIKALLKINWKDYSDEYVIGIFNPWVKSNAAINGLLDSIENIKGIEKTDTNAVDEAVANIRFNIDSSLNIKLEKGSIGLDFDDPEAHDQELEVNKITSGYDKFDAITEGGWDRKTFNVLMGGPGSGKSLWLQNFAVNAVNAGYNVAYITLELSDKKCLKRIGSMRLNIPIAEYTEKAKDKEFIKEKIKEANSKNSDSVFELKPGKLFIKEYPSGSATLSDLESHLTQVKEETGHEIDMLVVDYIQIMGTEKNVDRNMLYLKGEHLAVGLRAIAQKYNLACLTATQISKDKYNANNIDLNDIPESKAIADTADMVWAIILTPIMKQEGTYQLKHNKLRDCSTEYERIGFEFNKATLKVHSPTYVDNVL